ncbi:EamA family transporter [Candidatus Lucifugimonas marina]|uniref:EamA family transporter n=1 Tax=Candidatus Lucifugimonas marina TaxID=3038979 RepID=A0AAJ5ZIE8_9CHLR|nr:EamA family transporter [SAR202 cluster bacterium JH702]MDG0869267.1 EamA family transporter [SAR202 cluster bacterium JH639]WFG36670.1 EamA family transporter [SAR202 cluster bacterium JH545]WFG40604.1 EamA family transporter [SAR202 cluster bacterium JH1073]
MELSWVLPAIASPFVYALVSIGDKWILSTLKLRIESFNQFVGGTQLIIALAILVILGLPDAPFESIASAFGGGMIWGLALILLFWTLRSEEIGRVVPVSQTSPVFAAILGVVFLGEHLAWWGWLAVLLVVAGAAIVSADPQKIMSGGFKKVYLWVVLAAALIGIAQVLLKISSEHLGVWHNMSIRGSGLFLTLALPVLRPSVVKDLVTFITTKRTAIPVLITEGIGPIFGNGFLLLALANGPVSLVSALLGTRPIFILLITLAFAPIAKRALNEQFSRSDVVTKVVSTVAVVTGVVIISLA